MTSNASLVQVDPNRFGHYGWVDTTNGRLEPGDYLRMFWPGLRDGLRSMVGLLRLRFDLLPDSVPHVTFEDLEPPISSLTKRAVSMWADQSVEIQGHSCRTWMFGIALAKLDGVTKLDTEAFYCAALLHDYGLDKGPVCGVDFTLMGAERVRECASRDPRAAALADVMMDAICVHATIGISPSRDGALGYYLQAGSMADVGGLRRWAVGRRICEEVFKRSPSGSGFKSKIIELIRREAKAVPWGRFALYRRCGMTIGARLAPDHA